VPGAQVPVCTIEGITHYIELPATDTPVEKRSAAHHDHCQMCVFGAERLAALPVAAAPFEPGVGREAVQPSFQAVKSLFSFHPPAQPRAPPAAS
jgi:hypothetical protein